MPSWFFALVLVGASSAALMLTFSGTDLRSVLAPLLGICMISLIFWYRLLAREGGLPVYEIGSFYMLSMVAYAALPLIWYALSGMRFSLLSHYRLYLLDPTPQEFAEIGWMYSVHMAAFAFAYLSWRKREPVAASRLSVAPTALIVPVALLVSMKLFFIGLRIAYGVDFSTIYDESLYEHYAAYRQLPLLGQQLVHQAGGILTILNIAVVMLLVAHWRFQLARLVLVCWIAVACIDYLFNPGSRFVVLSMLITFAMAYHRFVKPIRLRHLALVAVLLFVAFVGAGFMRGGKSVFESREVYDQLDGYESFFTVSNEFQTAYGSALEFKRYLELGWLDPIPWQIYASEVLAVLPRQILPFEKIEPVSWYVEASQNPDYFNFSVLCQAILGFGWVELVLRGVLVGGIVAAVHNWWSRYPSNLWRNVFYVWLALMLYNAGVRNTSLNVVPMVLFYFLPLLLTVRVLEWLVEGASKHRRPPYL